MSKQRVHALEYIRGIAMLGVVGIHTGAYSLANPAVNIHLFALLEIVSRFSVPIFFFVSAFGLFYKDGLSSNWSYRQFMNRRLRTVLIPYLTWSLIYMLYYTITTGDPSPWLPPLLPQYLLFGLAGYQLYFLVILLWFYSLMPLWRCLTARIIRQPLSYLTALFILQIAFNYYSSYLLTSASNSYYVSLLLQYRLSYWVMHYIFIFLLGAVCAVQYDTFITWLRQHRRLVAMSFWLSLAAILSYYYALLYIKGYTPEQAVNTAHQLSPVGVLYTLTATLYLFSRFSLTKLPTVITAVLSKLGQHSYGVYLVHPLIMFQLIALIAIAGKQMTATIVLLFFTLTSVLSLGIAALIQQAAGQAPLVGLLLLGSKPAAKRNAICK